MDGSDGEGFKRGRPRDRSERIDIRVGVERRRKWSREDRLRIVQETLIKGAIIADVSRRNEVSPSLIYEWRKQALSGLLDGFHQVRVVPDTNAALPAIENHASAVADAKGELSPSPEQLPTLARGRVELTLPDGTVLRVDDDGERGALRIILASLDRRS
jgi:transposase